MRIAFEYLCLDCLFGRSHSCSCSCWSDSLCCCLLETSSFHSKRCCWFFFSDLLCWFKISIISERNEICCWFEHQSRKMDGWNHKEGWIGWWRTGFQLSQGDMGKISSAKALWQSSHQKKNINSTLVQIIAQSPPPIQQTEPEASGRCIMQEGINSGPCFPSLLTWTNDAVFVKECEKKPRAAGWEMPTFQLLSVCYLKDTYFYSSTDMVW